MRARDAKGRFTKKVTFTFDWTNQQQEALQDLITSSVKLLGWSVFAEAQKRVPISSGNLKGSGTLEFDEDSWVIKYAVPYAVRVETGKMDTVEVAPWVQKVPTHMRKTNKGNVRVAAHTKTYKVGKPVKMPDRQWRVFDNTNYRGSNFLSKSIGYVLLNTLSATDGLQKYLSPGYRI